jgi:hypothetical protein
MAPSNQGHKATLATNLSLLMVHGNNGKRTGGTRWDNNNEEEDVEEEAGAEEDKGDFFQ